MGQPVPSLTVRLWAVKTRRLQRRGVIARSLRGGLRCASVADKARHVGLAAALPLNLPSAAAPGIFPTNFDSRPLADKGGRKRNPFAPFCGVSASTARSDGRRERG